LIILLYLNSFSSQKRNPRRI